MFLFSHYLEPEAPPTELTGSTASDTSVSLQWKDVPYDFQNGQITQYYIKYFSIDNPSNVLYQWAPVSKQDVVNGLHYWTNYNCSVAAKTLKGTGPFTNYITVKTDEHSKHWILFSI